MVPDFLHAFALVLVAEFGDKSQLLALSLTARYRVRYVMIGLAIGITLNHGLAILLGAYIGEWLAGPWFGRVIGLAFIGFGIWTWKEAYEKPSTQVQVATGRSAIPTITLAFFLAEMGDKTQLAAGTLAATRDHPLMVLAGTTLAMLLLNALVVLLGDRLYRRFPIRKVRLAAAFLFLLTGVWLFMDTLV